MSFNLSILIWQRTTASHMLFLTWLATSTLPSLGALVVLLHVSLVSLVVARIVRAKVHSATCAAVATCLPRRRPGAAGTAR